MAEARAAIHQNVVSMRSEPSDRAEQVSQAIFGETVTVLGHSGDYSEISTPDCYCGWCLTRHLTVLETGARYPDPKHAVMVTSLFLPVFKNQSTRSERLTVLTLGTVVEVAHTNPMADLATIKFPNGESGFIESGALIVPEYPSKENLGPNLALVARGMIGVPYLWGGRTPFGIDCSGFTQRVYWLCGVSIPRDAYQQAASALFTEVGKDALRAGDLIFFAGEEDPRNRKITHVGISLADGRFIHASGKLGVTITPLNEPPYDLQFYCARRFV